jgi:allophanate hydrolase
MSEARLRVTACGPLVSYQDGGRRGMMRFGVPASGPMDRLAHAAAHAALGLPQGATAIEISMAGLQVSCESGEVTCCIAGGAFQVMHGGIAVTSWCVRTLRAGDELSVRPGRWGSWAYLAFAGELLCPRWAGSAATHAASGLGGGALDPGAVIVVRNSAVLEHREGVLAAPAFAGARQVVRVLMGPQTRHFDAESIAALQQQGFAVTSAYDRMGMRLAGPRLPPRDALSIPSEPLVRGSIQVAGDGVASILLADHQTTGGYPKIATVLSSDIDGVSQLRPGDRLSFQAMDAHQAIALARAHASSKARFFEELARPRDTLAERLMRENLISGMVEAGGAAPH